jgi:hypothetical protein
MGGELSPDPQRISMLRAAAAALQVCRANPWRIPWTLGIPSLALSMLWLEVGRAAKETSTGTIDHVLFTIVQSASWAILLAGQLRFCLAACRGHVPTVGGFFDGFRISGSLFRLALLLMVLWLLIDLLPVFGEELSWWNGLSFIWMLVFLFFFVRLSMAPVLVMDTQCDSIRALRTSWTLTQGRFWQIFGLGLLLSLGFGLLFRLVGGRVDVAVALSVLVLHPVWLLAHVNLYLGYRGQSSLSSEGHTHAAIR